MKKTPLFDRHVQAGARMVPFAGWSMPVQYTGIVEEHLFTRSHTGIFDISHMTEFFLKGPRAEKDVDKIVTCRIDALEKGMCRYGFILNNESGIIDDMIIFKMDTDEFMIVGNAGTIDKDREWIKAHISSDTVFDDKSDVVAKIDVQGPGASGIMAELIGQEAARDIKRFRFVQTEVFGVKTIVSHTGYTGEKGYELFIPVNDACHLWDGLCAIKDVKPVGLGARDSLRLEMGYSLYGHDIDEDHTPIESGLSNFVYFEKEFIGKAKLLEQRAQGVSRVLTGFLCESRRSAREGFLAMCGAEPVGLVTSGAFSPCLKRGIGLCYLDKEYAGEGQSIVLTDGRVKIQAEVKKPPFI